MFLEHFHIKIKVQDQIMFLLVISVGLLTGALLSTLLYTWDKICVYLVEASEISVPVFTFQECSTFPNIYHDYIAIYPE